MTPDQAARIAREVIEAAFCQDARIHAAQLHELRGCEINADIHPAPRGVLVQPWLTLVIEWPAAHTGPLKMTRQRVEGMVIATMLDIDLADLTEKELAEAAIFDAELGLTEQQMTGLGDHVRLNGAGAAKVLDLVQKAAALCVMPTTAHAAELGIAADFAWEHPAD